MLKALMENYNLYSDKVRSTFCTKKTLCQLLFQPNVPVATKEKTNNVNEINCSNYTAPYFGRAQNNVVTTTVQTASLNWLSAMQFFVWAVQ